MSKKKTASSSCGEMSTLYRLGTGSEWKRSKWKDGEDQGRVRNGWVAKSRVRRECFRKSEGGQREPHWIPLPKATRTLLHSPTRMTAEWSCSVLGDES